MTDREREVLTLLRAGKRNVEIAAALNIAEHTVETHLRRIYRKLGVRSRLKAVTVAGFQDVNRQDAKCAKL